MTPGRRSSRSLIIDGRHTFLHPVGRDVIEGADIAGNNRWSRRTYLAFRVAIPVSRLVRLDTGFLFVRSWLLGHLVIPPNWWS